MPCGGERKGRFGPCFVGISFVNKILTSLDDFTLYRKIDPRKVTILQGYWERNLPIFAIADNAGLWGAGYRHVEEREGGSKFY